MYDEDLVCRTQIKQPMRSNFNRFTATAIILLCLFLNSCSSGVKVSRSQVIYFDKSFSAKVLNKPYKTGSRYKTPTLLNLFEISEQPHSDTVHFSFNSKNELEVTYLARGQKLTDTFAGTFHRKGFYEIYLRKKKTEIPPFLPILYSSNDIYRIRLALTPGGNLIVDNKWDRTGNIFLMGGGSSERTQSFFNCITP